MKLKAAKKREEMNVQLSGIDQKLKEIKEKLQMFTQDIRSNPEAFEEFIKEYNLKIKQLEELISSSKAAVSASQEPEQTPVENPSWSHIIGEKITRVKTIIKGLAGTDSTFTSTITQYLPTSKSRIIQSMPSEH